MGEIVSTDSKLGGWVDRICAGFAVIHKEGWEVCKLLWQAYSSLGEDYYGVLSEVSKRVGLAEKTLDNYRRTYQSAIEQDYHRPTLPLSMHQSVELDGLDGSERGQLLDAAREQGWTVAETRKYAKQFLDAKRGIVPVVEKSDGGNSSEIPNSSPDVRLNGVTGTVWLVPDGETYLLRIQTGWGEHRHRVRVLE